ncbi:hypothetical protein [Desulfatiferula olefinivorans]
MRSTDHLKQAFIEKVDQLLNLHKEFGLLFLEDGESPGQREELHQLTSRRWVHGAALSGTSWKARNNLLDWVDSEFVSCEWIGRLDADDVIYDLDYLNSVKNVDISENTTWMLAGNRQIHNGICLRLNRAVKKLLDPLYLDERLVAMAEGNTNTELPSCNLWLRRGSGYRYPREESAEDHWLLAQLLLEYPEKGLVHEDWFWVDYCLDGDLSRINGEAGRALESRLRLKDWVKEWCRKNVLIC